MLVAILILVLRITWLSTVIFRRNLCYWISCLELIMLEWETGTIGEKTLSGGALHTHTRHEMRSEMPLMRNPSPIGTPMAAFPSPSTSSGCQTIRFLPFRLKRRRQSFPHWHSNGCRLFGSCRSV